MAINLMLDDRLCWREDTQLWRFDVGDEAHTVIYADYLHQMRDTLDMLENTGQLKPTKHTSAT